MYLNYKYILRPKLLVCIVYFMFAITLDGNMTTHLVLSDMVSRSHVPIEKIIHSIILRPKGYWTY